MSEQQMEFLTGHQLKQIGMDRAADVRADALTIAREEAEYLGKTTEFVHMDMVVPRMELRGVSSEDLGNAAGSVFKGGNWKFTGHRVMSKRPSNHAREIKVWRWVG